MFERCCAQTQSSRHITRQWSFSIPPPNNMRRLTLFLAGVAIVGNLAIAQDNRNDLRVMVVSLAARNFQSQGARRGDRREGLSGIPEFLREAAGLSGRLLVRQCRWPANHDVLPGEQGVVPGNAVGD